MPSILPDSEKTAYFYDKIDKIILVWKWIYFQKIKRYKTMTYAIFNDNDKVMLRYDYFKKVA